jgi:hypothetical protein
MKTPVPIRHLIPASLHDHFRREYPVMIKLTERVKSIKPNSTIEMYMLIQEYISPYRSWYCAELCLCIDNYWYEYGPINGDGGQGYSIFRLDPSDDILLSRDLENYQTLQIVTIQQIMLIIDICQTYLISDIWLVLKSRMFKKKLECNRRLPWLYEINDVYIEDDYNGRYWF